MTKQLIKITENDLHKIITKSVQNILSEENFVRYPKYGNPYIDKPQGENETKPLKKGVYLDSVRARLGNVMMALKNNRIDDAKKQVKRLYELVDAMINQS